MPTWFRVDDNTSGIRVLIEAKDSADAVRRYLEDYPPDLMVEEADAAEVADWQARDDDTAVWST